MPPPIHPLHAPDVAAHALRHFNAAGLAPESGFADDLSRPGRSPLGLERWLGARRVLALRLDGLSDLLMTTPALVAMRAALPLARISLLTSPAAAAAVPHLDMVDRTFTFTAPWVGSGSGMPGPLGDDEMIVLRQLRGQNFDAAIIFTQRSESALPAALLCRLAGIPLRLAITREHPHGLLSDWLPESGQPLSDASHEVTRQLALVRSVGMPEADTRLRFRVRDCDRHEAGRLLEGAGVLPAQPFLLVHPGAAASARRWPPHLFGAAAEAVARKTGCAVVFCGDAADAPLIHAARAAMQHSSVSLAEQISLGGLAAAIERAAVLIANNGAPAQLAAALGTPVVVLYALTHPRQEPWQVAQRSLSRDIECRWCELNVCPRPGHECLEGVSAAEAANAVLELMEKMHVAHDGAD